MWFIHLFQELVVPAGREASAVRHVAVLFQDHPLVVHNPSPRNEVVASNLDALGVGISNVGLKSFKIGLVGWLQIKTAKN